ncbi:hypothetical protein DFP96_105181 [Listeria rocourtiae]|uniref:Uncharacterized protein n=1 Tax=Listeria rocourtiae TaxID=647910 RepID=A0A4R6ZLP6_9LIST|nr:hypothetical protein PROCOU_10608 [Listeria rocourtiae FSL F6-920]TDR53255.1 hypothetical protein DFP96_105181 [Listeria rocourtiae]
MFEELSGGRQFHYIQLHIVVLKKLTTLFKNHNKAGSGGALHDTIRGLHARFALLHIEVLLASGFLLVSCYFLLGA